MRASRVPSCPRTKNGPGGKYDHPPKLIESEKPLRPAQPRRLPQLSDENSYDRNMSDSNLEDYRLRTGHPEPVRST